MAAPSPLAVRKVPNSSPALAKLTKHHRDHRLVTFTYGDFPRLRIIAKEGENVHHKSKIFARFARMCTRKTDTFKLSVVSLGYHPLEFPQL